ncbi:MAG: fibrinogen-like YCDxxxxGGGW domain-containing protein [Candidatus Saccharibacteria bacterium]|nr:fibrinogen-like YCDxxxxGGGW domain-containing protein [Candidatus Saccharibacteria bacterium]
MNLPLGCSKRKYRFSSGFTLVELVLVIFIIGVLSAILIFAYTGFTQKAKTASLQSDLADASTALKLFQAHNDKYPTTISTDCSASPDSDTNKCLRVTNGNTFNYYQANNTTSPYTFFLNAISSDGKLSYRITESNKPLLSSLTNTSCLAILNAGDSTGDGYYLIKPAATAYSAYCDMTNGGWTKLNNNIATATTAFNGSDILITNNIPGGCGSPGCAFTINNISVSHTNIKVLLTRTTSIVECASLVGATISQAYWDGFSWVNWGMCTWSDGIFANGTSIDMTGLKLLWKLEGPKAANGEIKFNSQCSDGTDSGQIQVTAWVK